MFGLKDSRFCAVIDSVNDNDNITGTDSMATTHPHFEEVDTFAFVAYRSKATGATLAIQDWNGLVQARRVFHDGAFLDSLAGPAFAQGATLYDCLDAAHAKR